MDGDGVKVVAVDITFAGDRLPESEFITKIESGVDVSLAKKIPSGEYDAFYIWLGESEWCRKADPTVQLANIQMAVDCVNISKQLNVKKYLCAGTVAENATFSLPTWRKPLAV